MIWANNCHVAAALKRAGRELLIGLFNFSDATQLPRELADQGEDVVVITPRIGLARACAEVICTFGLQPVATFTNDAYTGPKSFCACTRRPRRVTARRSARSPRPSLDRRPPCRG